VDGGAVVIVDVDVADPSRIPAVAEPFFLAFNAAVRFRVAMSAEEIARSGLDMMGRKYGG
jgi:hypothetical protein